MTVGNKIRSNFSSFPTLFYIYIFLTSAVKLHIHLLNVVVQFVFLTLNSDMLRYGYLCFNESLGIRDNESQL